MKEPPRAKGNESGSLKKARVKSSIREEGEETTREGGALINILT